MDDMLDEDDYKISDIQPQEFVDALKEHYNTITGDFLTLKQATQAILMIYSESDMETIAALDEKENKNDVDIDDDEENLLYFKGHLEEYFEKEQKGEDRISKDDLMKLVQENKILYYMEEQMNLEDQEDEQFGEDHMYDDENLDDEEFEDEKLDEDKDN